MLPNFVEENNERTMTSTLAHYSTKFSDIFSHISGWIMAVALFFADIFAGHGFLFGLVLAVTTLDAVWGVAVSIKTGHFALSELMRLTIGKLAVYGCALFAFAGLDTFIHSQTGLDVTVTTAVIGCLIVLTETWSSCGSMLILFPDFPFLRIMQKALTGEIARKLGVDESEVPELLSTDDIVEKLEKNKKSRPRARKAHDRDNHPEID